MSELPIDEEHPPPPPWVATDGGLPLRPRVRRQSRRGYQGPPAGTAPSDPGGVHAGVSKVRRTGGHAHNRRRGRYCARSLHPHRPRGNLRGIAVQVIPSAGPAPIRVTTRYRSNSAWLDLNTCEMPFFGLRPGCQVNNLHPSNGALCAPITGADARATLRRIAGVPPGGGDSAAVRDQIHNAARVRLLRRENE